MNINPEVFRRYTLAIQSHYNPVQYHNKTHAADVTQTNYYFMKKCGFETQAQMTQLEKVAMIVAPMVHDTDHPGFNNIFLINTTNKMALRYNDKSVLENHHVALAFDIMHHSEDMRIFDAFTFEVYKKIREMIVGMVLGTDMALHFKELGSMKDRVNSNDFSPQEKDKQECMVFLTHMSDISNPTKPWDLCYKWTHLLFIEFFNQGDKEKEFGLPVTFLMD